MMITLTNLCTVFALTTDMIDSFVDWRENNYLDLSVDVNRGMVIDFRKNKVPPSPIIIKGAEAEWEETYKYLGIILDSGPTGLEIEEKHVLSERKPHSLLLEKSQVFRCQSTSPPDVLYIDHLKCLK